MKATKPGIFLAVSIYLLLAGLAVGAYMIHEDAPRFDKLSPASAAGPATRTLSGIAASVGTVAAPWPSWVTPRDKETLDRAFKYMRAGESRKFMTSLMVFQDELEERRHGVLELKAVLISSLAGEVIASALTPVVFAVLMTISMIFIVAILSRTGINPLDALWRMTGFLVGAAGSLALKGALTGMMMVMFIVVGLWMRPFANLLYGVTELSAWLVGGLLAVWVAALTGLGAAPKPKMNKCSTCKGLGAVPAEKPGGDASGSAGTIFQVDDEGANNTLEIRPN